MLFKGFNTNTNANNNPLKVLKLELKEIREQQDLLFRFMNFLKQEGAVHVLQFCLTVGKFPTHVHLYSIFANIGPPLQRHGEVKDI